MEWFCSDGERSALKNRERRLTAAFRFLVASALAVFVFICFRIRTENAGTMHVVLMVFTAVSGWACILLYLTGIRETRTQLGHVNMLRDGEQRILEGQVALTRESVQIPKSIRIRKVLLDTGGDEPERLNLNEKWISRMPADGSQVRLAVSHSYIAGAETLSSAGERRQASGGSGKIRKTARLIPVLGIWTMAAVFFSSYVFYQVTDTDPGHKITIYMDGTTANESQLAARLEAGLGEPIRMVQIHPFSYAMFGSAALKSADLYIVPDSDREQFSEWFAPEEGIPVCEPETGVSVAGTWFLYSPGETYRIYQGAGSPHLEDGWARRTADLLLNMETEKEEKP